MTAIFGCDVSNLNGVVPTPVLGRVFDFVVVKASEGTTFTDPYFTANWQGARDAGLIRGSYHFGRPSTNSGHAEAAYFLKVVGALLPGDFLALDLEDTNVPDTADLHAYALDFLQTVEHAVGFKPFLYSGHWYLGPHNLEGHADLAQYGLWYASYQPNLPTPPAPWTFIAIQQYSASGSIPGIAGPVDLDRFFGTRDQLLKYGKP